MKSIEQAVGRLILGRLPGTVLDAEHRRLLKTGRLGGLTLFKDNASDLEQLTTLCRETIESSLHTPVLTVDQEGGAVQRFDHVLSPLPAPMALASLGPTALKLATRISAHQLKLLGFNLLLAPTLDLLTNAKNPIICTRAFGDDIQGVSKAGHIVIEEIEKAGLRACGKHFPGHGSTSEDSHLSLAVVAKTKAQLLKEDLLPFINNLPALSSVLIGHIWLPEIDKEPLPASLSSNIISVLLKEELGYKGLIVSDDMLMKGLTNQYGLGEACVLGILAGLDLLLVCGTIDETIEAHATIVQAVKSGRITQERLSHSINMLDKYFDKRPVAPGDDPEFLTRLTRQIDIDNAALLDLASKSPAINKGTLEKLTGHYKVLVPAHPRYPMPLYEQLQKQALAQVSFEELRYALNPEDDEIAFLKEKIRDQRTILLTFRSYINGGQLKLIEAVSCAKSLIHVALDSPYDLSASIDNASLAIALQDPSDLAIAGLALALAGKSQPSGKMQILH